MKGKHINLQITGIFIIIVLAFMGSAIIFITTNANSLKSYLASETTTTAYEVADILNSGESPDYEKDFGAELSFWVCDGEGNILSSGVSDGHSNIFSYDIFSGHDSSIFDPASYTTDFWISSGNFLTGSQQLCVIVRLSDENSYLVVKNDGSYIRSTLRSQTAFVIALDIVLIIVVIIVITNIISRYRKQIETLATTDEITGMSNRKSFDNRFEAYMKKKPEIASLFLLDIDYFKQINDSYGHSAGDRALAILAGKIDALCREHGGFCGRWGGDEFIGVLPVSGSEALTLLEYLCIDIKKTTESTDFTVTISVGISPFGEDTELWRISERADIALYSSKENGRDRATLYVSDMETRLADGKLLKSLIDKNPSAPKAPEDEAVAAPQPKKRRALPQGLMIFEKNNFLKGIVEAVWWMMPFISGGGILIALAFLFDAASVDISLLSAAERADFGSITNIAATLKSLGETTFNFMLPVFAAFMARSLAGNEAFLSGFVGGFLAIDSNAGFVGALIAGMVAAFITYQIKQFSGHFPKFLKSATPIIISPVLNLILMFLVSHYIISPVSGSFGYVFENLLTEAGARSDILSNALASMMMATDMGGIRWPTTSPSHPLAAAQAQ